MKTLYILWSMALILAFTADQVLAQQQPDQKEEKAWYKEVLSGDSVKAEKTQQIMAAYKAEMRALEGNQQLSTDDRREKIRALIEDKNNQLRAILNQQEQEKIIPGTERARIKEN